MQLMLTSSKRTLYPCLTVLYGILFMLLTTTAGCSHSPTYHSDEGAIWATEYHIKYKAPRQMTDSILSTLRHVEMSVSVFNDSSLVSLLNRSSSVTADSILSRLFIASQRINRLSNGLFDPTLGPLIELWGFGRNHSLSATPSDSMISHALEYVGIAECSISADGKITKKHPLTQFNFSAIAKGLACDEIGMMLRRNGITDYMIEIGGEVAVSGHNPHGEKWRLSVDAPMTDESSPATHHRLTVIDVTDCGVATSGNYRNYHHIDGSTVGHTLSPVTGRPTDSRCMSATVIAPDCMTADALATSCMAMTPDSALTMVESINGASALLVLPGSPYTIVTTQGFPQLHY